MSAETEPAGEGAPGRPDDGRVDDSTRAALRAAILEAAADLGAGLVDDFSALEAVARYFESRPSATEVETLGAELRALGVDTSTLRATVESMLGVAPDVPDRYAVRAGRDGVFRPVAPERPQADVVLLSTVAPRPIAWLWPGRLARGKETLLSGDPGAGKSFVAIDLAARVSVGAAWPDLAAGGRPAGVVLVCGEDDVADTIRPRLDAAGGDPARVAVLQTVRGAEGRRRGVTLADLPAIGTALDAVRDPALLVIDPLGLHLGDVDDHRNAEVRGALGALVDLARERGVALLVVHHLRKADGRGVALSLGSIGIVGAARIGLVAVRDPDDPARRLLIPAKVNIADDRTGHAYRIAGEPPRVEWEPGTTTDTLDEVLERLRRGQERRRTGPAVEEAGAWLRQQLATGPVPVADLHDRARGAGFSPRTLRRARESLAVVVQKVGMGRGWTWGLPGADPLSGHLRAEGPKPPLASPPTEGGQVGHLRGAANFEGGPRPPEGGQVVTFGGSPPNGTSDGVRSKMAGYATPCGACLPCRAGHREHCARYGPR